MRKLFLLSVVLPGFLVVFQSCSKQSPANAVAPINTNVINATIAPNGSYQLPIPNSGNVSISRQASHYLVSQAGLDSKSGVMVYKYIPVADYVGADEVVLSNTKTSIITGSGCSSNHSSNSESTATSTSFITVKINIAN